MEAPMPVTNDLWNQLFRLKAKETLIPLVYDQLSRDFQRTGCILPFDARLPPEQWVTKLSDALEKQSSTVLQQLIYLIDLPESLTAAILVSENRYHELAESMLHRELVKIYFKLNYSGNH